MTTDDADVLGRVASLLRRADLAMLAVKEPPLRKAGVSGSTYAVLMNLRLAPGSTGAELARVVGVTPQAIAQIVGKLVDRGSVERRTHPRHANVQELHLPDSGQRDLAGADRIMVDLDQHLRRKIGVVGYERLGALLGQVIEHLDTWQGPNDVPS